MRHAQKGKKISPKKDRDEYTRLSYPTAKKTAKKIDRLFKKVSLFALTHWYFIFNEILDLQRTATS